MLFKTWPWSSAEDSPEKDRRKLILSIFWRSSVAEFLRFLRVPPVFSSLLDQKCPGQHPHLSANWRDWHIAPLTPHLSWQERTRQIDRWAEGIGTSVERSWQRKPFVRSWAIAWLNQNGELPHHQQTKWRERPAMELSLETSNNCKLQHVVSLH